MMDETISLAVQLSLMTLVFEHLKASHTPGTKRINFAQTKSF
jgi:hypothetical protein